MRLLTGPAGSGKTSIVLDQFRQALRSGNDAVRLLVPTATMAQHLQNRMAREDFVFRRSLIQTLSGFVDSWAADLPQVPDTVFQLIVEEAVRRVNRHEFARVAQTRGFCSTLARTMAEFSSAGCDSSRLAANLPDAPLAHAFLAVYAETDRELQRRGLALRAKRLARAAARIEAEGLGGIRTIWLDGFHALPDPELDVIAALARHAEVTVTLAEVDVTQAAQQRFAALDCYEEGAGRSRPTPVPALVKAPSIEREVEEIARRILQQAAAGRPFREIGIIVRPADHYVPILRSTLERFGIPARFYFDSDLEQHAVIRYLSGAVEAMLSSWDHEKTLAALRLAPRFADSNAMDRFDFEVRKQIPNSGLGGLHALAENDRLIHKLDSLAPLEEWRSFVLTPRDWAARFRLLHELFRPARPSHADHELALVWRSQAAVLEAFDEALDEAAQSLAVERRIPVEAYWRTVKSVLRLKPLRFDDGRRNVVHVLSAPESRQWVLPVVFICGMVEKQFPQFHRQDPFFPDAARCKLNLAGIRVRTAAEWEREERGLFASAVSRATLLVTLSYPEFDTRGDRTLPSLFLENFVLAADDSRAVRPAPRHLPGKAHAGIQSAALLAHLTERTQRVSPSKLESYLQCPFQYFAGRLMRLQTTPPRPEERLDFMAQGTIVHAVLAEWWQQPRDIGALFEEIFARTLEVGCIPMRYHTERLRNQMLDDLRAFVAFGFAPKPGTESRTELEFDFPLVDGITINGKIDRLDIAADGSAFVTDYKYSRAIKTRIEDPNLLQAPLYVLAAERKFGLHAVGMQYVGVKGEVQVAGWDRDFPEGFRENAEARTLEAVAAIRRGRLHPEPADADRCRFCDYRDVCRFEASAAAAIAEGV